MFPLGGKGNPVFSWICRVFVMLPERICHATFLSHFSPRISAVVCFRYVTITHVIGRLGNLYKRNCDQDLLENAKL